MVGISHLIIHHLVKKNEQDIDVPQYLNYYWVKFLIRNFGPPTRQDYRPHFEKLASNDPLKKRRQPFLKK